MSPTSRSSFAARIYFSLLPIAVASLLPAALHAQTDIQAGNAQPAPIERQQTSQPMARAPYMSYTTTLAVGQVLAPTNGTASAQPAAGVYLRVAPNSAVRAVSIDAQHAEFKVERGLINLSVHDPVKGQLVLVDLPGGQVQPLKNGFYTINAATNTVRVLKGEADVFVGTDQNAKPIKLKEDHSVTFPAPGTSVAKVRSVEFYPYEASTDVIATAGAYARSTDGPRYGEGFQGYGYPGYGFYGYPYYAWDYPYYGYGYPFGFGLGFGYGFGGGFYRGGYGGGFRGRR